MSEPTTEDKRTEGFTDWSLAATRQAVIATTPEGVILAWNPHAETLYGWTAAEALGQNIVELIPSEQAATEAEAIMKTLGAGESWSGEFPVQRKDGSTFVVFVSDTPLANESGDITAIVGVSHDAAERRLHQRGAEHNAALLHLTLGAASTGTWTWDMSAGTATWDATMAALFGLPSDVFAFGSLASYLHPDDAGPVMAAVEAARQGSGSVVNEFRVIWPDGSIHWLIARGRFVYRDGVRDAMVGTVTDIDERKRTEAALSAAAQLRAAQDRRAIQILQEALVRPEFPHVENFDIAARYLPADSDTGLGGDWYDSFTLGDGRIMMGIGDVAGHGIRAARLMAKLRHATRAYSCIDPDPTYVLRQLDRFLEHFGADDEFATMQLIVLDPTSGVYDLVSAGHPPAVRIDRQDVTFLAPEATPPIGIGLLPETINAYRSILAAEQALVLYTDGLIERHNEPIDQGLQRLTQSFSLPATSAELCDAALTGCLTGGHRNDDICIFAVRHKAKGELKNQTPRGMFGRDGQR